MEETQTVLYTVINNATAPAYAHEGDSGLDLRSTMYVEILPWSWKLIPTGISVALPPNTEGQIRSRSGLALKNGVFVLNSPGTIDSNYRGELQVILFNASQERFKVNINDRIAQFVVTPVYTVELQQVDILPSTVRNSNGFGSSGIK